MKFQYKMTDVGVMLIESILRLLWRKCYGKMEMHVLPSTTGDSLLRPSGGKAQVIQLTVTVVRSGQISRYFGFKIQNLFISRTGRF